MPKVAPTQEELAREYASGVTAKAGKWQRKFLAATGIADAAKSDQAEAAYQAQMSVVLAAKLRQRGLANVTDDQIKESVRAGGPGLYSTPATAKAAKMARKALPFVQAAVEEANRLPGRTADGEANVDNRVKPIVRRLQAMKRGGGT